MAKLSCPRCGGMAYGKRGCLWWILVIGTFPFGLILLLMPTTFRCRHCGTIFK